MSSITTWITLFYYYVEVIRLTIHTLLIQRRKCTVNRGPAFSNSMVIMGDDIAFGMGDSKNLFQIPGLAPKLAYLLQKSPNIKQTWNIYNCGVVGSTSFDWLPNSEKKSEEVTLFERIFSKHQDSKIVLLMVGYNDGRRGNISPHQTLDNIASIVKILLNMGKQVYVCPILNHKDHLVNDTLYGDNLERNEMIISYCSNESRPNLFLGPHINNMNYEYRGEFLYTEDGQLFNQKGYTKFASDFTDVLLNDLVKIEFRQFKEKLGL